MRQCVLILLIRIAGDDIGKDTGGLRLPKQFIFSDLDLSLEAVNKQNSTAPFCYFLKYKQKKKRRTLPVRWLTLGGHVLYSNDTVNPLISVKRF